MKRRESLSGQIIAANLLLVVAALFAASAASNLDLLAYVEETARPYGATFRRFPNKEGDKASLLVTIGPEVGGGVALSGHTDVVPTEGQAWTGDPWTMGAAPAACQPRITGSWSIRPSAWYSR